MSNGKPLTELRMEIELGLYIYHRGGYCSISKSFSDGKYVYSYYIDEEWGSWEELLAGMGERAIEAVWTTFDSYFGHPSIDEIMLRRGGQ